MNTKFLFLVLIIVSIISIISAKEKEPSVAQDATLADDPTKIEINATWVKRNQTIATTIKVKRSEHEIYDFHPKLIGENKIKFMNARNLSYYYREVSYPLATVWLLSVGGRGKKKPKLNYTSKRLFETAYRLGFQLHIRCTHEFDLVVSDEGLEQLYYEGQVVDKLPDAVLPRLGAKVDYFGLAVVRHLEKIGVLVLNEHNALDTSRDKLHTLQDLGAHNLPIPKTMIAKFPVNIETVKKEFSFPLILKRSSGTQGKGVMLVENEKFLLAVGEMIDVSSPMIFQEFIKKSSGRDIRAIVVGGKVIGAMMRVANHGFKANYHQGGYVKGIKLSQAIEWLAIKAARLVDLEIAGVDLLIDEKTYRICEINSSPGFEGFELATGVDVPYHILDFVKIRTGVKGRREKKTQRPLIVPIEKHHLNDSEQVEVGLNGEQKEVS
ncbi:alpha-L-glutamate ligase [Acrasis kona]|uniref:N-acetylaspartylglutamate synthase n=1 Tax=Acrasis kona TaxID=1008807 RepID=A0AAW2ZL02_9EUKA